MTQAGTTTVPSADAGAGGWATAAVRAWLPLIVVGLGVALWFAVSDMPMEILSYWEDIAYLFGQHMQLVLMSAALAIATGLLAGIVLSRPAFDSVSEFILQVFNLGTTIPTLAVLALCMTLLGIGIVPAVFGLWAATLLPIVRNTYTGLKSTPAPLLDAATGTGMTPVQIFRHVEFPNALFVILTGIRTAVAINVGTAPLAFLIGAGGWGELIFTGIALNDLPMMLAGAIPTALLAVVADFLLAQLQFFIVPRGINPLR